MFPRTGRIESMRRCDGVTVVAYFRVDCGISCRFREHCCFGGVVFELVRMNFQTFQMDLRRYHRFQERRHCPEVPDE